MRHLDPPMLQGLHFTQFGSQLSLFHHAVPRTLLHDSECNRRFLTLCICHSWRKSPRGTQRGRSLCRNTNADESSWGGTDKKTDWALVELVISTKRFIEVEPFFSWVNVVPPQTSYLVGWRVCWGYKSALYHLSGWTCLGTVHGSQGWQGQKTQEYIFFPLHFVVTHKPERMQTWNTLFKFQSSINITKIKVGDTHPRRKLNPWTQTSMLP